MCIMTSYIYMCVYIYIYRKRERFPYKEKQLFWDSKFRVVLLIIFTIKLLITLTINCCSAMVSS